MIRVLLVLLALPAFAIVGGLVAIPLTNGYSDEDPSDPSRMATVMAVWDFEGGSLCRAFNLSDLIPHRDTLDLRFALSASDLPGCRADFAAYDDRGSWPRRLPDRDLAYPGYDFEIESPSPEFAVVVHRSSGDATWTSTRYRVSPEGSLSGLETLGAGPGSGLGSVMGGFVGVLVWLGWAVWLGVAAWRRRRQAG